MPQTQACLVLVGTSELGRGVVELAVRRDEGLLLQASRLALARQLRLQLDKARLRRRHRCLALAQIEWRLLRPSRGWRSGSKDLDRWARRRLVSLRVRLLDSRCRRMDHHRRTIRVCLRAGGVELGEPVVVIEGWLLRRLRVGQRGSSQDVVEILVGHSRQRQCGGKRGATLPAKSTRRPGVVSKQGRSRTDRKHTRFLPSSFADTLDNVCRGLRDDWLTQ